MGDESFIHLTTERCVLHPIKAGDAAMLHALWSSPGVRRFLWDDEIIPMARTQEAIARSMQSFEQRRFGLWGAKPCDGAHLIGFAGLWWFRDPPELELLYGIAEEEWGHGYATEIARA